MRRITNSEEETLALGREIGLAAKPGEVYALEGDLGVGKTVFAKGFAEGLGIDEAVISPTFTIMQIYEGGRMPLYHFDVYRIEEPEEMDEIGYEEYFFGQGVCLVEWADLLPEIMPKETIRIRVSKEPEKGFSYRRIEIEGLEGQGLEE
ncbi:MAG: tRNA (adenosine(37)-N6)-threonylcarbamoyltransferase complex ATPase subunit type 1 TsaE [Lachnospiraceae bacterium]|nr:tRNA (adenosine(37)-N6)-threonylcarbamoyltransferase complex ATPase subunit type 1 TsaE [Lachnospiraceae bacterium]